MQFRDEVLAFVRRGLRDISVSRSIERARGWGIGVPDDPTQVIYVWFDALTNYVSGLGFGDPESDDYRRWWVQSDHRVHVVGKGITRFHAVYWPAFLASAGQPLPTRIQVHPYLTVDGAKLSKSSGATVDPFDVVASYGTDALRWWFASDVGSVADTDFTIGRLVARANEDLANGLGNLTHRIATLVAAARDHGITIADTEPLAAVRNLGDTVTNCLLDFDLRAATAAINDAVSAVNNDLEATQPWQLLRHRPPDDAAVADVLGRQLASVHLIASATRSIVPALADRLTTRLSRGGPTAPPHTRLIPHGQADGDRPAGQTGVVTRSHECCEACGFDGGVYSDWALLDGLRGLGDRWRERLAEAGDRLRSRPAPVTWSAIEYAEHSRDITALHAHGVEQALTSDEPTYPAISDDLVEAAAAGYGDADPNDVADALTVAAEQLARLAEEAGADRWNRGLTVGETRSDVRRLLEHALHDSLHHLDDVERGLATLAG